METIGGYRLVRTLGEGPRAVVHLARLDGENEQDASVVLKRYRPEVREQDVSTEIEALARAVGEHVVPLLDVTMSYTGPPALVLGRLVGGGLGRLLAHRHAIGAGEAVGILRPVLAAVTRMHTAGAVHGALRADAVLFDRDGHPVLACFGRAGLIEPGLAPARLDADAAVAADRRSLSELAGTVLERVDDAETVSGLLHWLRARDEGAGSWRTEELAELGARLDQLTVGRPVDLRSTSEFPVTSMVPARISLPALGEASGQVGERRPGAARRRSRRAGRAVDSRESGGTVRSGASSGAGMIARLLGSLLAGLPDGLPLRAAIESARQVRARFWIAGGIAVVALTVGLVASGLLSSTAPSGPAGAGSTGQATTREVTAREVTARELAAREVTTGDGIPLAADGPGLTDAPGDGTAARVDDGAAGAAGIPLAPGDPESPAAAAVRLLELRAACLQSRSVPCLDGVAQQGSAALAEDRGLVLALQGGAADPSRLVPEPGQVTEVQRLGDAALVTLDGIQPGQPTALLLTRGGGEWLIRGYLGG